MTDKEMAVRYADNYNLMNKDLSPKSPRHIVIEAFLAGLKADRPKWHNLQKDPNDLPKHCRYGTRTSEHVLVKFKSGNTGVCYFDFDLLGWFANGYPEQLKNIIAWCEIPKFVEADE
jgi:hypothetical protein